ncbi:piggyBac transposable element-derived protein 4-like [Procambarus clarkii]|uniref:piggyBac transposable element-derived protein 4-like n=1 Tax=Procambarus clarkii TaxID=6728 RepID=UPI003743F597
MGVCGTVKTNRREMPGFDNNIGVGDCELRKCDKILEVCWKDKREVNMLTTIHTGEMLDSGKVRYRGDGSLFKPDCIIDYNINMRLVDKCDMMVGAVECVRRTVKWTRKFFFHLVDVTVPQLFQHVYDENGQKNFN